MRYQLAYVDAARVDGPALPLFQLTRSVNEGAAWEQAGGSAAVLTGFRIDLRTNSNQPTFDRSAARALRVRLGLVVYPRIADGGFLTGMRVLRWRVLMRPPRLQKYAAE